MVDDIHFIKHAFKLAKLGKFTTSPNPNVGCVIVKDKKIIGVGYHKYTGGPHAEIYALNMAGKLAKGATAYITLEPCNYYGHTPSCADALIQAGITRVVFSILDPNPQVRGKGLEKLKKAGISIKYGLISSKVKSLNLGFLKRMNTGYPWIKLKLAISLDGCTVSSFRDEKNKWITSEESRKDVQILRASSDAILSTANTVLSDNPLLTVRWSVLPQYIKDIYLEKYLRQPIRIIIDNQNLVNINHKIVQEKGNLWLIRKKKDDLKWPSSVKQIIISTKNQEESNKYIDLMGLMKYLGSCQINNVLVESGINFANALIKTKLVDELILYQSPKILGNIKHNLLGLSSIYSCNKSSFLKLKILNVKKIGPDVRIILKVF